MIGLRSVRPSSTQLAAGIVSKALAACAPKVADAKRIVASDCDIAIRKIEMWASDKEDYATRVPNLLHLLRSPTFLNALLTELAHHQGGAFIKLPKVSGVGSMLRAHSSALRECMEAVAGFAEAAADGLIDRQEAAVGRGEIREAIEWLLRLDSVLAKAEREGVIAVAEVQSAGRCGG